MKTLRPFAFALFLIAFSLTASAQQPSGASIYATVVVGNYGFYNSTNPDIVYKGVSTGIGGGFTTNLPIKSRVTLGFDIRGSVNPAANGGADGAVALRLGFVPHRNRLRPYIQLGGGFVSANERTQDYPGPFTLQNPRPTQSLRVTNGARTASAGLDVRLTNSLDLRLIEYGASGDSATNFDRTGFGYIRSGIVYHLRPVRYK